MNTKPAACTKFKKTQIASAQCIQAVYHCSYKKSNTRKRLTDSHTPKISRFPTVNKHTWKVKLLAHQTSATMEANQAADEYSHLAISLFNIDRRSETRPEYLTSETITPPQTSSLRIQRKREIALSLSGPEDCNDHIRVRISSVTGLCHGQLLIDAPHFLNNKTVCIQLPRTRALNFGLQLLLSRPGQVEGMTVLYDPPTMNSCATLQIAMPLPAENEPVGILTYEIGGNRQPILTEIGNEDPQSALIRMARTLAFEGAYARQNQPFQTETPSTSSAPF